MLKTPRHRPSPANNPSSVFFLLPRKEPRRTEPKPYNRQVVALQYYYNRPDCTAQRPATDFGDRAEKQNHGACLGGCSRAQLRQRHVSRPGSPPSRPGSFAKSPCRFGITCPEPASPSLLFVTVRYHHHIRRPSASSSGGQLGTGHIREGALEITRSFPHCLFPWPDDCYDQMVI